MSNFVAILDKVKLGHNTREVFKFVFPDLEKLLNHVLNTFADLTFLQDLAETRENRIAACLCNFLQALAALLEEVTGQLDRIPSWLRQEQR